MSILDDAKGVEMLAMLGIAAVGVYYVWKFFNTSTCIAKVGTIPGITGATAAQANAAKIANQTLQPGGSVIWSSSTNSDYDYAQPNGDVVQVRHSFFGQLFGNPVTYTTIPRDTYVRPSGGIVNPGFACCYSCADIAALPCAATPMA